MNSLISFLIKMTKLNGRGFLRQKPILSFMRKDS
nr:MAG TPA: hypothetical protein [Caudoviricetes sp.]DAV60169.1 MAG TPA: hypothetical protein [Caudoviricetes sp.]